MTTQTLAPPDATAPHPPRRRASNLYPHTRPAWVFLAPFAVFFLLFLAWPVVYMIITSFFNTSVVKPGLGGFAGLGNYREMLTSNLFWGAMGHTLLFAALTVPPASTSSSTWPPCRTSPASCTRPRPPTAPRRGSSSAGSPCRCWAGRPRWWSCCRSSRA